MRLVDRPYFRPQHCAAIPHRGQTATEAGERWVDTGAEMPGFDNHVYLSETAVVEAARLLGHPTPNEHRKLQEELARALQDNLDLISRLKAVGHMEAAFEELAASTA